MRQIKCERVVSNETGVMLKAFVPPANDDIPDVIATGPIAELKDKWAKGESESIYLVEVLEDNGELVGVYSFLLSCGILFEKFLKDVNDGNENVASTDSDGTEELDGNPLGLLLQGVTLPNTTLANDVGGRKLSRSEEHQEVPANRITKSHPAVKIEYWAKNYSLQAKKVELEYKSLFNRKLGEDVFWRIIAKKILEGSEYFYSQYCYLFAADNSRNEKLTEYYVRLGFKKLDDLNVLCSDDDAECPCLAMPMGEIRERVEDRTSALRPISVWS